MPVLLTHIQTLRHLWPCEPVRRRHTRLLLCTHLPVLLPAFAESPQILNIIPDNLSLTHDIFQLALQIIITVHQRSLLLLKNLHLQLHVSILFLKMNHPFCLPITFLHAWLYYILDLWPYQSYIIIPWLIQTWFRTLHRSEKWWRILRKCLLSSFLGISKCPRSLIRIRARSNLH